MSKYPYGAVLKVQREDSRGDLRHHLERMRDVGCTIVVVWPAVYWWEDPLEAGYPYQTGHYLLRTAGELGLDVIMELGGQITSLEYAPDFKMSKDLLVQDMHGHPVELDWSYYAINYNHPKVREMVTDAFRDIATEYRVHESLYGYDVWNETMFTSYDEHTLERFRGWLKEKYGTIPALNDSWERVYKQWSDVRFTNWHWASVMPYVDWEEFRKDNIGMILDEWRSAVKESDADRPVLADNVGSMVVNGQWGCLRTSIGKGCAHTMATCAWLADDKDRGEGPRRFLGALASDLDLRVSESSNPAVHLAVLERPGERLAMCFNYSGVEQESRVRIRLRNGDN